MQERSQTLLPLSLYVPEPAARPGEPSRFDDMEIPPAGSVRQPHFLDSEATLRDMPYTLVRVLDDNNMATQRWDPCLPSATLREGLQAMVLTRSFDDRLFRAHRQGKTSFYMKSTGEEAIGAAQSLALNPGDMCFPTYRVMSWLHARKCPLDMMLNQIFSNDVRRQHQWHRFEVVN